MTTALSLWFWKDERTDCPRPLIFRQGTPVRPLAASIASAISRPVIGPLAALMRAFIYCTAYCAAPEPWIGLAAPHGDSPDAVTRFQHLEHGLDMLHALGEARGFPLVVFDLPAYLGMELFEGIFGLLARDLCYGHAGKIGPDRSVHLWRLPHNTGNSRVIAPRPRMQPGAGVGHFPAD
jgi:hypothetical protein